MLLKNKDNVVKLKFDIVNRLWTWYNII
jgi:hypothetical protein